MAKVANGFHVTAINSKNKTVRGLENPYRPFTVRWNINWKARVGTDAFGQHTHEPNHPRMRLRGLKGIFLFEIEEFACAADDKFRFKGEPSQQL